MMTMTRDKSFEGVAAAYDEVRPGYPSAAYDRIIEFGGLTAATKVLEVGVGTGKATIPFAERGFAASSRVLSCQQSRARI